MPFTLPGTTADTILGCAYLLWIAITLCGLLRWRKPLPALASILAPSWPLFAPYPIVYNYELAFRVRQGDGSFTPWRQLPTRYARALYHAVWNPRFHEQLFLFKLCQALVEVPEGEGGVDRLRLGAFDLLHSLAAPRIGARPETIQFMIRRCCPLTPDGVHVFLVCNHEQPEDVS
jgi:hypothetical protein